MDQSTQSIALVHGRARRPIYDQWRRSRPALVNQSPTGYFSEKHLSFS
jgi:hypothetical protein